MVDSHALVGSCAQIGERVHISAAAQIGGVLEPVGALPVIIEDDVLVGGNCGVYEGAVVKRRAVLAAGTILTGSTPIYDLPNERVIEPVPGQPLIVPEGAVVVPGSRPIIEGRRPAVGPLGGHADHRQVPRRADRRTDCARSMDPVAALAFARALIDIDSTTGRERAAGDWLAGVLRERGYQVTEQPLARGCCESGARRSMSRRCVFSTHYDCVPPFFPVARRRRPALRPRRLRRQGYSGGAAGRGRTPAGQRRAARRSAVRGRRGARQRRRGAGECAAPGVALPGQRRAHRQPAGNSDARGVAGQAACARAGLPLRRTRAWRVGDRPADRCADPAARPAAAERPRHGRDLLHRRPDRRRRRAERGVTARLRRGPLPHRRIGRRRAGGHRAARVDGRDRGSAAGPAGQAAHASTGSSRRCSRSRPTFRCSTHGARRCCSDRARFSSPTPARSISTWAKWPRQSTPTNASRAGCSADPSDLAESLRPAPASRSRPPPASLRRCRARPRSPASARC